MSELTAKLLKIASDIDSLIEKIASEPIEEVQNTKETEKLAATKTATEEVIKESGGFGSVSDYATKSRNPLLDFILS